MDFWKREVVTREDVEMSTEGLDIQGIYWFKEETRKILRQSREYSSFRSCDKYNEGPKDEEHKDNQRNFYQFNKSFLKIKAAATHFQLLNLLWCLGPNSVFLHLDSRIACFNPLTGKIKYILSPDFQVSSFCVKNNLLVIGGLTGEMSIKRLNCKDVICSKFISDGFAITNSVIIVEDLYGNQKVIASNNDQKVRIFDVETAKQVDKFNYEWPINCTDLSPDKRLLCVVGDSKTTIISDTRSGEIIYEVTEHEDYSFACTWSPDGRHLATGNQDKTLRIYDTRNFQRSVHVKNCKYGSVRSLRFTSDSRFLGASEDVDNVHIFDSASDFTHSQVIDMFGEIGGICFTEESLYIVNIEPSIGCLAKFDINSPSYGDIVI